MSTSGMYRRPFEGRHLVPEYIVALMQWCHNFDFGHFELSMQEDCTFEAKFFLIKTSFLSRLSAIGQFIFCLWSMCTTFSHNSKNITQNGQNQNCDAIALKRRYGSH